jgi:hypothetical protein
MDFRTKLFSLAGAVTLFTGMAYGQNYCGVVGGTASTVSLAVPSGASFIRQEGQTELLPVLTLTCGNAGTVTATANLNLYLSPAVSITSASVGSGKVEASATAGSGVVQGVVTGSTLTFTGITIPAGTSTITIANIRVNAAALPTGAAGSLPSPISAQAFVSGTGVTPSVSGTPTVAYAFAALGANSGKVYTSSAETSTGITSSFAVCNGINTTSTTGGASIYLSGAGGTSAYIAINEGFQNAFKTLAEEAGNGAGAYGANSGTRIKLVFANVPAGLSLFVPQTVPGVTAAGGSTASGSTLTLVASELAPTGAANVTTVATSPASINTLGLVAVPLSGTTATAIYEVTADNPNANDYFAIPLDLVASTNSLAVSTSAMTVTTGLGPQPATAASVLPSFSASAPTVTTTSLLSFTPCTTNLLFPFVTNANGFETGIAISNTSKDPFSTKTQSGICTLNFYSSGVSGATNPTAVTAPNLAEGANQPYLAGETYAFTLTQSLGVNASNPATFQGYVIAQCGFSYAHAFAYILGGLQPGMFVNPNNTAMGYLAIVLPSSRSTTVADSVGN